MTDTLRLTLAQLNPTVGDLTGNARLARLAWEEARAAGTRMVVLPEAFLTGYQTQDLVMRPPFWHDAMAHLARLARELHEADPAGPALGIGAPFHDGRHLYNAWNILEHGGVRLRILKQILPNEGVFDEKRHFTAGPPQGPWRLGTALIGTPICEDAWYPHAVCDTLAAAGAELLVVPNGSPYYRGKMAVRREHMRARVAETGLPLVYLNLVGGQDDQVFDGGSFVLDAQGEVVVQLPQFDEAIEHVEFARGPGREAGTADEAGWQPAPGLIAPLPEAHEADYRTMVAALRDYLAKTGFEKVLLGLSGGVDSALVAAIAADALGPENVRCVMLPSQFTSETSLEDARAVAEALGCRLDTLPISAGQEAVTETLAPLFTGLAPDVTEENIQSRLRGLLLMALSNKFGEMLLTTGNKSEMSVGYATIYGDMAGGYNPLKDLYKTRVFATCRWRNAHHRPWMKGPEGPVIPERVIEKPPSAELRPDQKDEDSLPPYEVLDAILEGLIDREASFTELAAEGFDPQVLRKVERLIFLSEYKRFQAAPGTRLTPRALWLDRRYPIVNRWRDPGPEGT